MPKRMLGRVTLIPNIKLRSATLARLLFEMQLLRYLLPLVPFVIAMITWPHLALPIAQAPVPMVMVIVFFEMKVLAVKREDRAGIVSDADMARTLDALRFNANRLLIRLAAKRNLTRGELVLVIEQSELARITPLTLVSVQQPEPEPHVVSLDAADRALIEDMLFDQDLTERALHNVALRENENLRAIALDVSTISAHARMTALLNDVPQAAQGTKE